MKEELENEGSVGRMAAFEVIDLRVALRPYCLGNEIVYAHNQHIFVVRAIEDCDFAPFRHLRFDAPQKIVGQFFLGWLFEVRHAASVWVHRADDVLDHAVFAAGVESLQADQQGTFLFREQHLLQLAHLFAEPRSFYESSLFAVFALEFRVEVADPHAAAGRNAKVFDVVFTRHCFSIVDEYSPRRAATLHWARWTRAFCAAETFASS